MNGNGRHRKTLYFYNEGEDIVWSYIEIYSWVKSSDFELTNQNWTKTSKGLEWDTVVIMDDMNDRLYKIIDELEELVYITNKSAESTDERITIIDAMTESQKQEFLLYYVGCSRSKHKLINAKHLNSGKIIE